MTTRTISGVTQTLDYDKAHRLTGITGGGDTTGFLYDADGNRVRTTTDGTYAYQWGDWTWTTGDDPEMVYRFGGVLVAARAGDGKLWWSIDDHLSSTTVQYHAGTDTVRHQRYLPFGKVRIDDGVTTDVGYTGQRLDATGLMFYQARYYDPLIGRFTSADTLVPDPSNPQDLNRYSYVNNNPLKYTDPTGHAIEGFIEDPDERQRAFVGYNSASLQPQIVYPTRVASAGWGRFLSLKHWTNAVADTATGADAADYMDRILAESLKAGVDPVMVLAILHKESRGRQRWGLGSVIFDVAVGTFRSSGSIGLGQMQAATFGQTVAGHPDAFSGAGDRVWMQTTIDEDTAIRAIVWHMADLQQLVTDVSDRRSGSASSLGLNDLVAYGYNSGPSALRRVMSGERSDPYMEYVRDIADHHYPWAKGRYCSGDWRC